MRSPTLDAAAPSLWSGWLERLLGTRGLAFFRYHGVWAPGVRLLRVWSFRTKILALLLLLGLPLVWMGVELTLQRVQTLKQHDQRLAGAALARATYGMAGQLHAEYRARLLGTAQDLPDPARLQAAARLLHERYEATLASGIALQPDWEAQHAIFERAVQATAGSEAERQDTLRLALNALVALHRVVVDRSGVLLLDDAPTKALASTAYNHLPALQAETAQLESALRRLVVLLAGDQRPDGAAVRQALLLAASLTEAAERSVRRIQENERAAPEVLGTSRPFSQESQALLREVDGLLADPARTASAAELLPRFGALAQTLAKARLHLAQELVLALESQREAEWRNLMRLALSLALVALGGLYISVTTFLVMRGGLAVLERSMTRMADGDLSSPMPPLGRDEIATTLKALDRAATGLSDLLASVREGVAAFRQASQQIADGNGQLKSRSAQMAQSLDTLVSGVADYSAQLEACGQQVEVVVQSVQRLRLDAARNRKHVARLEERMQALVGKTREIGQIVSLIDGIAFRTNILALNASIEASKAGNEVGRGFAVVAMEVRSLAQRTASSAQRIAGIVAGSSEDFAFASELVVQTGRCMAESDRHVDEIHTAMTQVSTLSQEGTRRAVALVEGLHAVEQNTRDNLRLVEQLATASTALRMQGEKLTHKIGRFRLS